MPQQQSTTPGQPQAAQQVEQHLVAAGVPQQAIDHAKAHGLNVQTVLGIVTKFLPVILQIVQELGQGQGGGATAQAQAQPRQPSTQHSPGVVSDPDIGAP